MNEILIIDDNPLFRLGLREVIKQVRPDIKIVEKDNYSDARVHLKKSSEVAMIMVDIRVRDFGGFVGLFQLRSEFAGTPIIVFTERTDADTVSRALAFGAAGCISKSAPCDALARALKSSLSEKGFGSMPIIAQADQLSPLAALSPAQMRVLRSLKKGICNRQMAFELGLSEKTVKAYMSTLYRKLGVSSRSQALLLAQQILR